jgi:cell division inhibitor SepF
MIMEEMERPSLWGRLTGWVHRDEEEGAYDDYPDEVAEPRLRVQSLDRTHTTVRRHMVSMSDAVAAADGLKMGQHQIINLTSTPAELQEKIKAFMCGVNYYADGTWEEIGEHIYLLAPNSAYVEVASASPRVRSAVR